MPTAKATPALNTTIGNAMLGAIPGHGRTLDTKTLEHGCRIMCKGKQLSSSYVSDNTGDNVVEFALNQNLLAESSLERAALVRWLNDYQQRFGFEPPKPHQRGIPVDWCRLGFATAADALNFLRAFERQRRKNLPADRWQASPGETVATVTSASAVANHSAAPQDKEAQREDDEADEDLPAETAARIGIQGHDFYALACLPILVDHVLHQTDGVMQKMTYEELAHRMGRIDSRGHTVSIGMGKILGLAMDHVDRVSTPAVVPYLTTFVVGKSSVNKGLPGIGVRERWLGYDKLKRKEKVDRLEAEYLLIMQFGSRWADILAKLGLASANKGTATAVNLLGPGGWGGIESEAHKMLKEYVRTHPTMFGAGADWDAVAEHAMRSCDRIDVFFRSDRAWIGVEVKSVVSDGNEQDYERGLYQVVKYHAVLAAQAKIDYPKSPPAVKVLLALDNTLPAPLRKVAASLGVQVIEHLAAARGHVTEGGGC